MARAKNVSRSEARRRSREQTRTDLVADEDTLNGDDPTTTATAAPSARSAFRFKFPDVQADARALPGMFRARPLLFLPFALLLIGFAVALAANLIPVDLQQWALLYIQYFFLPQALFTYFIGGFLAPRGSYLVGLLLGLVCGVLWLILISISPQAPDAVGAPTDIGSILSYALVQPLVLGTLAGGFAGWYRDFLRGMQDRSRQRQAERETTLKAQRRDERQEARRNAKQRPTG